MKKEITKRIPPNKAVALTFDIYEGYDSVEELETKMCSLGIFEKQFIAIYFNKQYYGVVNHSSDTALVYGKDYAWIKESNIWSREPVFNLTIPFVPKELSKGQTYNSEIVRDMMLVDPDFQVFNRYKAEWRNVRGLYQYSYQFAELLGRTFYSTFFNRNNLHILTLYNLNNDLSVEKNLENPRVEGINPFRTEALFKSGKTHKILI